MPEPAKGSDRANIEVSPEAYNKVVDSAVLRDIKLISSTFYVRPNFFDLRDKVELSINKKCTDCTDVEEGTIVAFFSFEVHGRLRDHDEDDNEVMEASAVYLAAYNVDPDSQATEAAAFCKRVGLFAAYPYFRALVAHWAADADLDIPPIPLISAPPRTSNVEAAKPKNRPAKKSSGAKRLNKGKQTQAPSDVTE